MLIVFPIGLWVFSLVSDVIYQMRWGTAVWNDVAFYTMAGGLVGALVAAIPGLVDLVSMSPGPAKRIGIWHMVINLVVVAIFALNLWLRMSATTTPINPIWLSVVGVVLLCVSGWLGGEMVYVHGVSVEPRSTVTGHEGPRATTPRRVA